MKAIVVKKTVFDVVNIVMSSKGIIFPCPVLVVLDDDLVYIRYSTSTALYKASAILGELGIRHQIVKTYNI